MNYPKTEYQKAIEHDTAMYLRMPIRLVNKHTGKEATKEEIEKMFPKPEHSYLEE